jgi:fibronectin type 3 domain-containing protein
VERSDDGIAFTAVSTVTVTSFSDPAVVDGGSYYYRVIALDGAGNESSPSATVLAVVDSIPPTPPTALTAVADGPSQVTLTWSGGSDNIGIAGYDIFRNGLPLTQVPGTSFTDTGLAAATLYTYAVRTVDLAGNASNPISTQVSTLVDTQAPTLPTGLAANAISQSQIQVSWAASTDNVAVAGYHVYRDSVTSPAGTTDQLTFIDGPFSPSELHNYRITAFDASGNETPVASSPVVVARTFPAAPTALAAVDAPADAGGVVNLSWTPWPSAFVTEQRIYRALIAGGPYSLIATITNNTTASFQNTGLTNGTAYFYVVRSFDGVNESANSNESSAIPQNNSAPVAPTSLFAVDTTGDEGGSITLHWTPSTSGGVTQQRIYRATAPGAFGPSPIATLTGNTAINYVDNGPGLVNGDTYYYVVRAFNGIAESISSNQASAVPVDNVAPLPPTALTAGDTPNDNGHSITLGWTVSASGGAVSQRIYRATASGGPYGQVAIIQDNVTRTYVDGTANNGITYYYVVRASDGTNESANSNQASAVATDDLVPQAPTGLAAADTPGDNGGRITLTWTPSVASDVVEQRIVRATSPAGPFNLLVTLPGNVTATYLDATTTDGVTYYYRVRAFDGTSVSADSNTANGVSLNDLPPTAPTGLAAADLPADDGGRIRLTWTPSSATDVISQRIYRGTAPGSYGPSPIATLFNNTTTSFVDTGLVNGTTYYYVVRAYDGVQEGPSSNEAGASPADNGAPAPPTGLAAADVPGDQGFALRLTWTPSTSTGVTQQRIYRGTTSGSWPTLVTTISDNTTSAYTDTSGLINGTTYYYQVRSFNGVESVGIGEASAAPIDNLSPFAPTALSAADTTPDAGGSITLTWTPSTSVDVTEQHVYRGTISGGPYTRIKTLAGNLATTYADNTTTNGTTYYYVIRAFDGTSESGNSIQAAAISIDNLASAVGQAGVAYILQADAYPANVTRGQSFLVRYAVRDQQGQSVSGLSAGAFAGLVLTNLGSGLALTPGIDYTATWVGERAEGDGIYDVRVALSASAAIAPGSTLQVQGSLADGTATDGRLMRAATNVFVETAAPAAAFRWGAVQPAAVNIAANATTFAATARFYDGALAPTDDGNQAWSLVSWSDSAGGSKTPSFTANFNAGTGAYDLQFSGITAMTPGLRQYVTVRYTASPQVSRQFSFSLVTGPAGATPVPLVNVYYADPQLYVPPTASINGPGTVEEGSVITLAGNVGTATDGIAQYEWDMSYDGVTFNTDATGPLVSYNYGASSAGIYTVAFRATDNLGSVSTGTAQVVVVKTVGGNALPQVSVLGPATALVDAAVDFTTNAVDTDGTVVQYEWDFNYAGSPGLFVAQPGVTGPAATWTFATPGLHQVAVRVTDNAGGQGVGTLTLSVEYGPPTADIQATAQ